MSLYLDHTSCSVSFFLFPLFISSTVFNFFQLCMFVFLLLLSVTSTVCRLQCCTRGFLWRFWKWSVCVDKRLADVYDCREDVIGPDRR